MMVVSYMILCDLGTFFYPIGYIVIIWTLLIKDKDALVGSDYLYIYLNLIV